MKLTNEEVQSAEKLLEEAEYYEKMAHLREDQQGMDYWRGYSEALMRLLSWLHADKVKIR